LERERKLKVSENYIIACKEAGANPRLIRKC